MRVLVVEDQQPKSARICTALTESGVAADDIVVVMDAASAKRELRKTFFELAVIDVAIPSHVDGQVQRDGGLRLVDELLREDGYHQPLHVFGLTAFPDLAGAAESVPRSVFSVQIFDETASEWKRALAIRVRQVASARRELAGGNQERVRLGIVCALDAPELSSVLALPWNWQEIILPSDPTIYYKGHFDAGRDRHPVVAASCARMGLTAAAVATTKIINAFKPEYLAMVGIAAGVPSRVALGDVIVADPVWDWGSGKWTAREDVLTFAPAPHQVDLEAMIRNRFRRLASDTVALARIKAGFQGPKPPTELRIRVGPLASGAAVLADGETITRILEQHRYLLGVDMEAYGVMAAAAESAMPRPNAFVVKGVVDFADGKKDDSVQDYAAHCSAHVLRTFVEEFFVAMPVGTPL
ncbi:MAG TPA: histidine kinase [Thermoanaerobaculia bacterium]|nr:histidine kinase [Thermoanaerobaculia bacterium]